MTNFNAWSDPWVSARPVDGSPETLSLRDLFARAHTLAALGPGLTPLDTDSMLRLLPALGASILRTLPSDGDWGFTGEGRYPSEAIEAFEASTDLTLFDLFGERPFLQRWDRRPSELAALADDKGKFLLHDDKNKSLLNPIEQLHPHEPGASSSQWAVRRDDRDAGDLSQVVPLLATAWFQTKNGNSKDPFGCGATKGSTGTWHVNPLGVFLVRPTNLGRTLMANTPVEWIEGPSIPAFLDRAQDVPDIASRPLDLYRCTYAKTLPLLYPQDGRVLGFILGADTSIPVPVLAAGAKASLSEVHAHDHTRLYVRDTKKGTLAPRGSFGGRLSSTEGFGRWFAADNTIGQAIEDWRAIERVASPAENLTGWLIGLHSEATDGKGTRQWSDWSELPARVAGGDPFAYAAAVTLMGLVAKFRGAAYFGAKAATDAGKDVAAADTVQAALFARLYPQVAKALAVLDVDPDADMRDAAARLVETAIDSFTESTEPYATPQNIAAVSQARANFARTARGSFNKIYPAPAAPTSGADR